MAVAIFWIVVKNDFNLSDIKSVLLAQVSIDTNQIGYGTAVLLLDELKVYERTIPTVLGCDGVEAGSSTSEIYFTTDMDLESLKSAEYYYFRGLRA